MPPVDFYAGAIATVVVILFAKFDTHRRHNERWKMAHIACAITAWLGLVLSLLVLGWTLSDFEEGLRHAVALVVMVAGSILALDVAWPHQPRATPGNPRDDQARMEEGGDSPRAHPDDQPSSQAL
jgi:hypothetical protein